MSENQLRHVNNHILMVLDTLLHAIDRILPRTLIVSNTEGIVFLLEELFPVSRIPQILVIPPLVIHLAPH